MRVQWAVFGAGPKNLAVLQVAANSSTRANVRLQRNAACAQEGRDPGLSMAEFVSPKPFKTTIQVREYLAAERIQCLLCGDRFKSLSQHLRSVHEMMKREYHLKFRIPRRYALVCPDLAARLSKLERERGARDANYAARRTKILNEGREGAQIARIDRGLRRSPLLPDAFDTEYEDRLRGMSKADRMVYLRAKLAEPRK